MALAIPITMLVFLAIGVLALLIGADSRPGFSDGRTDVKEHWSTGERFEAWY